MSKVRFVNHARPVDFLVAVGKNTPIHIAVPADNGQIELSALITATNPPVVHSCRHSQTEAESDLTYRRILHQLGYDAIYDRPWTEASVNVFLSFANQYTAAVSISRLYGHGRSTAVPTAIDEIHNSFEFYSEVMGRQPSSSFSNAAFAPHTIKMPRLSDTLEKLGGSASFADTDVVLSDKELTLCLSHVNRCTDRYAGFTPLVIPYLGLAQTSLIDHMALCIFHAPEKNFKEELDHIHDNLSMSAYVMIISRLRRLMDLLKDSGTELTKRILLRELPKTDYAGVEARVTDEMSAGHEHCSVRPSAETYLTEPGVRLPPAVDTGRIGTLVVGSVADAAVLKSLSEPEYIGRHGHINEDGTSTVFDSATGKMIVSKRIHPVVADDVTKLSVSGLSTLDKLVDVPSVDDLPDAVQDAPLLLRQWIRDSTRRLKEPE